MFKVKFPDGTFVTKDRDFYGIGSRSFSPAEIYEHRGHVPMLFSCFMNAQNCAWYTGHGATIAQCAPDSQAELDN